VPRVPRGRAPWRARPGVRRSDATARVRTTDTAADWSAAPNSATQPNGLASTSHTFFDTGDIDHVRLSLVKDHLYSVRTFALYGAADTYMELLATDGTTVLASHNDRGTTLPESKLTFVARPRGTSTRA